MVVVNYRYGQSKAAKASRPAPAVVAPPAPPRPLRPAPTADYGLTARERQILAHVVDGKSNIEVAQALYLSEDTIKTHLRRVFRKLGVSSRTGAVALAVRTNTIWVERSGSAPALSPRELEVLELLADGLDNRDIGDRLGLSHLTVKSHLARMTKRFGTGDRVVMVRTGIATGLIR